MTEDEARTKLCWRTLQAHAGHEGGLMQLPVHGGLCRASDCMAWMHSYEPGDDGYCGPTFTAAAHGLVGHPPGTAISQPPTEPTPS